MDTLFFYTVYKVISVLGILFYNSLPKSYYNYSTSGPAVYSINNGIINYPGNVMTITGDCHNIGFLLYHC